MAEKHSSHRTAPLSDSRSFFKFDSTSIKPYSVKTTITSPANAVYKKFLSLTTSRGLKDTGLFLLSGERLIREFLAQPNLEVEAELTRPGLTPLFSSCPQFELDRALYDEIDVVGTRFNIFVVRQPDLKAYAPQTPTRGLQVICPLGDPGNLGALIRSAEAFGVNLVIVTKEAAHPFLPKALKASAGSVLRLPIAWGPPLGEFSDQNIYALDKGGKALESFQWPADLRLVIGEEGPGLKGLKFSNKLSITTVGVESLNAVVAASIAFHEYRRKMRK